MTSLPPESSRLPARALPFLAGAMAVLALVSSSSAEPSGCVRRARLLMGTTCEVTACDPDPERARAAATAALDAIAAAEDVLSTWRPDAEASRVNAAAAHAPIGVSPELALALGRALDWADATDGAFDPVVGALVDAWDLRGAGRIPSSDELEAARAASGRRLVILDRELRTVRFTRAGAWIDTGGFGKGHALDLAAEAIRKLGVTSALLDFGGQLLAIGGPPGEDAWHVAIADPSDRGRPAVRLALRDASASTSGQSERSVEVGGRIVGHVLDPRTGEPVPTTASVTVVAPSALDADALSTALLVMGPDDGLAWARSRDVGAAFLTPSSQADRPPLIASTDGFARIAEESPRPAPSPTRGDIR